MNIQKAIAVVGLGAILPDAYDVASFWNNIINKKDSIGEVPADRWSIALYYDPDPRAVDKTYSKIGAFIKNYQFDPFKAGIAIPPRVLSLMDHAQQWGLAASYQALKDYGYPQKPLNPERVAVILGNALAGEGHYRSTFRILLPEYLASLESIPEFKNLSAATQQAILSGITGDIYSKIPAITEDTMPGELGNIIAGRIANVFNFSGPNFITDAACASSLAALQAAVDGLANNHFDAVLCGGVDRNMGPESFIKFSKIGALSAEGSRPYSDKADGFVMGEGAVIFLLKRLEDAERDGDKIYALIRGIGGSSDGKGKGITAPNPLGQQRAIERALLNAGITPQEVGLIEGHGTSTKVGDVAELNSLKTVFGAYGLANGSIALGSVKSNIGHLKSAAGAVGLLKTILALNEKILPPSANFVTPNPNIDFGNIPFEVNTQPREWQVKPGNYRFAGVSSFGFGGTNFHIVLEEYFPGVLGSDKPSYAVPLKIEKEQEVLAEMTQPRSIENISAVQTVGYDNSRITDFVLESISEKTGYPREMLDLELDLEADLGIDTVKQAELFASIRTHYNIARREDLRLSDYNTIAKVVEFMTDALSGQTTQTEGENKQPVNVQIDQKTAPIEEAAKSNEGHPYQGLYFLSADSKIALQQKLEADLVSIKNGQTPPSVCPTRVEVSRSERLAIDYENADELVKRCEKAISAFETDQPVTWNALQAHGIYRGSGTPGKTVFMFPGQGSQYVNMIRDLLEVEPVVRDTFKEADEILTPILGKPLTSYIYADGNEEALAQAEIELKNTTITQPALLTANVALLRLMDKFGFSPDFVIGHSLGEYAALVASGVLTFAEALEVVSARGREMSRIKVDDPGGMAAVSAPLEEVEKVIKAVEGYIVIANVNSPVQSVLGGTSEAIESAISMFKEAGFQAVRIPVSHAFHTKIVAPASEPVRQVIERMHVVAPNIPIVANVTGELYPSTAEGITDLLAKQVASPVQFVKSMQTLYNLGTRVFVEVGPKRVLNALATDNMKGKTDTIVLATNHPRKGGQASFNEALCGLYAAGVLSKEAIDNQINEPDAHIDMKSQVVQQFENNLHQFAVLTGSVVVTGAGLGLPGRNKKVFDDNNINSLLNGEMRIESIPENIRKEMLEKRVTRLIKSDSGAVMEEITDIDQTLKLAGQRGTFNLEEEYGVPAERVDSLDISTQLAFAAGIDALRDAGIPLVMHHRRTSKGTLLPDGWKLPESMQDETGVIFCSAFPGLNRMAEEAGRFYEAKSLQRQLSEVMAMEDLLLALNPTGQTHFQNEIIRRKTELELKLDEVNYHFDRRFIFRVLSMGHSQFAEYIGARGPNTSVNAACATTTQGINIAEDWIRTGRCRRVIVIAGDDVSDNNLASWIGTSLFASGAATTEGNLRLAALPFDKRRNGLIMGMGAAALIIESQDGAEERGIRPICEIVASQFSNSAFHGTRLDVTHVAGLMETLVATAEKRFGLERNAIAAKTVFISHETYTPARGGSASAEIFALRHTFKDNANKVIIANTKGYTGHTMGVGVEDVLAVKALETGKVPPIAHINEGFEPDPDLGDLLLSQGGEYNPEFALRLGAGFGSQIAMVLYRKIAGAGERINQNVYRNWLKSNSGYALADLEIEKRTLRVKSQGIPVNEPIKSTWQFGLLPGRWAVNAELSNNKYSESMTVTIPEHQRISTQVTRVEQPSIEIKSNQVFADNDSIKAHVLEVVSEKTGYPMEMLDLDLDLEADLGIDTVKQAELFASIRTNYGIPRREDLKLSDYNTLEKVIGFVKDSLPGASVQTYVQKTAEIELTDLPQITVATIENSEVAVTTKEDDLSIFVLSTVSEKTGYPIEMLDLDLDLEADLGIDTVKQAELFAAIRTHFGIAKREDLRLSDYNTLSKVIGFVKDGTSPKINEPNNSEASSKSVLEVQVVEENQPTSQTSQVNEKPITLRVPKPVLLPRIDLCESTGINLENGRVIILKGQTRLTSDTAKQLAKILVAKKVDVIILEAGSSFEKVDEWLKTGPLTGVYCLTGLDTDPEWNESRAVTWKNAIDLKIEPLFELVKMIPSSAFLISATRMGGLHGLMNPANPLGGALSGFTKAYSRERNAALVKTVDFQVNAKANFIAESLIEETLNDGASLEIGRENELRFTISLDEIQNQSLGQLNFSAEDVFLVSGGTGGITSVVIDDLAKRSKGHFILLSRTPLLEMNEIDLGILKNDPPAYKNKLLKEMSASGDKVTPIQLEARFNALERAAATRDLIAKIEAYGGKATYINCDVADLTSVKNAIAEVAKTVDHVDYFIHAAGFEKSRKLESKFMYLFTVLEKAKRTPKSVVFFSSIAGRFGNAGQPDYSAGNDFLSKMAIWLPTQYPALQVISLDWGAWAEVGMASRGSIPLVMERAGIEMLKPGQAAPVVGDQILAGSSGEIVVAGNLGLFERMKSKNHDMNVPLADAALRAGNPIHTMLSHLTGYSPDSGITLEVTLDPQEKAYLRDHSINGIPVLPGVVGIEGFTRAAKHISSALAAANSGFEVERLENIEFLAPFKFYGNRSRAMAWKAGATRVQEGLRVDVTLESDTERVMGKVDHVQHFKGQVYLTLKDIVTPNNAVPPKWGKNNEVTAAEIYQLFFHGPSFQVLEAAQRSGNNVLGRFNNSLIDINADEPGLFTTPLLIELCFQTAGLWEAGSTGNLGLPHSIGKLRVYRNVINGTSIFAEVKPKEVDGQLFFDARVVDSKGNVYLDLSDYRTTPQVDTPEDHHLMPMKVLVGKERK